LTCSEETPAATHPGKSVKNASSEPFTLQELEAWVAQAEEESDLDEDLGYIIDDHVLVDDVPNFETDGIDQAALPWSSELKKEREAVCEQRLRIVIEKSLTFASSYDRPAATAAGWNIAFWSFMRKMVAPSPSK